MNGTPTVPETCTLLQGSTEFFPALCLAMDNAVYEICFETYLFETAEQGEVVAQALESAALRGVRVRVVLDGIGSRNISAQWLARWRKAGVQCRFFSPLGTARIWFPSRWRDRKSTRLNSSHSQQSRMPSSA